MIKLKKILLEYDEPISMPVVNKKYITTRAFTIGPDGICWITDYHGYVLKMYPELLNKFNEGLDKTPQRVLKYINLVKMGSEILYSWMFSNGFIRGGRTKPDRTFFNFERINNKQKDTIIKMIEKNRNQYMDVDVELYKNGESHSYNNYNLQEFWKKYLT